MKQKRQGTEFDQILRRFSWMIETGLAWTWPQAAVELGYKTNATLYAVRAGKGFPDILKLACLSSKALKDGKRPNIDWIVTGHGAPFVNLIIADPQNSIAAVVEGLPKRKQNALRALLTED